MKYIYLIILLSSIACTRKPTDHFILQGTVPGAMDSTEINLSTEGQDNQILASGYITNGKFELQGKIDQPAYCRLGMNNQEAYDRTGIKDRSQLKYVEIRFFIENGQLSFHTPHIDSLPKSFWKYDIRKEKNYTLKGSIAQDQFFNYQQQTIPRRFRIQTLQRDYMQNKQAEDYIACREEQAKLEHDIFNFIRQSQNLAVNLYLAEQLKKDPFTYDQAYLDKLDNLFSTCQDTCLLLSEFRQYIDQARAFVQGKPLQDGEIITPAGENVSLLGQLKKDRYSVIDFWASWCVPCRASFPHLRKMYKQHGDKIEFISLSLDKGEKEWQQAIVNEKLPWPQFLCSREMVKTTRTLYNIASIPTFLIIDPAGNIIFTGHESDELEIELAKITAFE